MYEQKYYRLTFENLEACICFNMTKYKPNSIKFMLKI